MAQRDEVRVSHEEHWAQLRTWVQTLKGTCADVLFSLDHDADHLVGRELEEFLHHAGLAVPLAEEIQEACAKRPRE